MTKKNTLTVMAIGETGAGKSENGNAMLMTNGAFEADSKPESVTFLTSAKSNKINDMDVYYIDTQGFGSTDNLDSKHIQQMVEFLKGWKYGINAFFILINIFNPRFDSGIQRMLQVINDFFNNPNLWNQTGLIFTRCYQDCFEKADREVAENEYRACVIDFIRAFKNCKKLNPEIPCFFVDSKEWKNDKNTQDEYIKAFNFARKFPPVRTDDFKTPLYEYKKIEDENLPHVLVKYDVTNSGDKKIITKYFEDQKRKKIIGYNNEITYTEPETIKAYTETEEVDISKPLPPPPIIIVHHKSTCNIS